MKKSLLVVAIATVVLGVAGWSYAHGPGFGNAPGVGFSRMGPGMMGPGMMGPGMHGPQYMQEAGESGNVPCWQTTKLTPEQKQQYEERAKTAVEHYLQRFLPDYKLEKKTTE